MTPLYTQCPQCNTVYDIAVRTLCEALGQVRCGRCGEVFQALERLSQKAPGRDELPVRFHSERPPTLVPVDRQDDPERDLFLDRDEDDRGLFGGDDIDDELDEAPLPTIDFGSLDAVVPGDPTRPRPVHDPDDRWQLATRRRRGWAWVLGSVLLALVLVGQYGWWEREQLLDDPRVRPWLDRVCGVLDCRLPLRRDLDRISLVNRDIRPHPSVDDALIINATLHNEADFPQPYPAVEIRLSDLEGKPVAARRFEPEEYLEEDRGATAGMAPGTMLPLVFEVVDPGDQAVAFEFVFR